MKKLLATLFALFAIGPALAQTPTTPAIAAMVCANNTVVPTPVNGQFFYVQCDSSGKLITSGGGSSGITIGTTTITGGADTRVLFQDGTTVGENSAFTFNKSTGNLTSTLYNGNTFTNGTGTLTLGSVTLNAGAGGTLGSNAFTSTAYLPLSGGTLTGSLLFSPDGTLNIGANAATRPNNVFVAASVNVNGTTLQNGGIGVGFATGYLQYGNQTVLRNISDGVFKFGNAAETGFSRIVLGGITTSFPAIKRNAANINFRLADDSGDTSITALNATISGAYISAGAAPTLSGTCITGSQTGGNTAGSFTATCVSQTVILTFATTAPTGWACRASDLSTPTDVLNQTATSTTTATLTGTTVAADTINFSCLAY